MRPDSGSAGPRGVLRLDVGIRDAAFPGRDIAATAIREVLGLGLVYLGLRLLHLRLACQHGGLAQLVARVAQLGNLQVGRHLGIELSQYFAFLSLSYAPGLRLQTGDELLDHVRAHTPERLAELERVLAVDLPQGGLPEESPGDR